MFEEYKDLFQFTSKTVDENIEFHRKKESVPTKDLFDTWIKLSNQAKNFDKHDWTSNWPNWHKNLQGFERHKMEGKFLIQTYMVDVLKEMISRLVKMCNEYAKASEEKSSTNILNDELSELIKNEIKRQIKVEFANRKSKYRKK